MPRKQNDLPSIEGPGVAPKRIKAVEDAADAYVTARNTRMAATRDEVKTKDSLIAVMQGNHLSVYHFDDETIELLSGKITVKVRKISDDLDQGGNDEEPEYL